VRTRSSRPGERTAANAARTVSTSIGPVAAPAPRNASTAASAVAAFCAWWAPNSGRNTSSYSPPRPCSRSCWPPTATAAPGRRTRCPPRDHVASTSTPGAPARRAPRLLVGEHGDRVALDDPGLLAGDRADVGPEVLGVVQRHRGDDGDPRVGDVGGVPRAAHADLDDGDVDRGVGEQRVGHADHDLEEAHRDVAGGVDHLHVGRDVVVGLDEPLATRSTPRRRRSAARCTSGTSSATPTPTSSPATSGCAARGLLPDGLGRQRPADRAPGAELLRRPLRPVAALRPGLQPPEKPDPKRPDADLPAQLRRAVRAADRGGREGLRAAVAPARACRSTGR
jgi:hypothetical protein